MTGRHFFQAAQQDVAPGFIRRAMALPSVAFLLLSLPAFGAASPALHVMVDAGHGGVDKGAVRGHLHESEIALKVANELAQLLREDSQRFKVSMTRTTDTKVSLKSRTEMAKDALLLEVRARIAPKVAVAAKPAAPKP